MDDYAREMMELKTLVTRTLEKKGVLARIRAELRASVFEAIEEEDRVAENNSNLSPALLGSCNDRAKQLHISPSGRLLTALIGEYLDWAQLGHTLKVYLPECNLPRDFWKEELKDFSSSNKNGESGPLLLDVLEGYLKYENLMQNRLAGSSSLINSDSESVSSAEIRNVRRPSTLSSSSAVPGGLPSLDRTIPRVHSSDRRSGSSIPSTRKDDYMWRYDAEVSDDVMQAANALENIHLDRKARNMTTTWRQANDGIIEDIGMMDRQ